MRYNTQEHRRSSKKGLYFSVVFALALLGGVFFYVHSSSVTSTVKSALNGSVSFSRPSTDSSQAALVINQITARDANHNGVPDWQEGIQNAEPLDDPAASTTPAPEVTISAASTSSALPADPSLGPVTQAMVQSALVQLSQPSGQSGAQPTFSLQDLATTNPLLAASVSPKQYSLQDLAITASTTDAAVLEYVERTLLLYTFESKAYPGDEMTITSQATQSGKKSDLAPLASIADGYAKFAQSLLKVKTPQSMADTQLHLVNALSGLATATTNLQSALSDPLRAAMGVTQHQQYAKEFLQAIQQVSEKGKVLTKSP